MTKYTSDYKRPGRNIEDKPRKKRIKQYNKNGFVILGERPPRPPQYCEVSE